MQIQKEHHGLITSNNMSEKEFVQWFKGFSEGVHHYNITPAQWDHVKEKLAEVRSQGSYNYFVDPKYWTTSVA